MCRAPVRRTADGNATAKTEETICLQLRKYAILLYYLITFQIKLCPCYQRLAPAVTNGLNFFFP